METHQVPPASNSSKRPEGRKIKSLKSLIITCVIILLLGFLGTTCWYTVNDKQQAVVTTLGKVNDVTDAGIHFMLPFGIQKAHKVNVNMYQKIELGYRTSGSEAGEYVVIDDESKMITGDYNIVNVDFFVEYKISDPVRYLFGSYDPENVLRNLVQSQVRNVVGSTPVDSVLTDGKEAVQMEVKDMIIAVLEEYNIGLMLTDVKIQDSEPPTAEVTEAFKSVETAKQSAETAINEARAYRNAQLPAAQAEADKLTQNAEYLKQKRINEAIEQVAMFEAMYEEYSLNPQITRSRMYYEAIQKTLPNAKVYIDATGEGGSVNMMLPLESFAGASAQGGNSNED